MGRLIELVGQRFGQLTVISRAGSASYDGATWLCQCDCGNDAIKNGQGLRIGRVKSCGCLQRIARLKNARKKVPALAGKLFGKLTVIERARNGTALQDSWRCDCACGGTRLVPSYELVAGLTKSCGCDNLKKVKDLTGRTFDRLTVIRRIENRKEKVAWLCSCSCGNEHKAISATLLAGTVRSCGCLRLESSNGFKDLAGRTFGRLTVIRRASLPRSKKMQWLCLCTCGTETVLLRCNIVSGGTMSCGCARKERAVIRSASLRATMCITSHRRRARVAGSKGTFTEAEVVALYNVQKGRCAEPGCRVKLGTAFHRDHINPLHLGGSNYITNIQLLCPSCNCRKCAKHPITWARENGRLL